MDEVVDLHRRQSGVVSRRQLTALGLSDATIRRRLRRKDWARVFPGVFVDHTGPLTWQQRAWAAVLLLAPAALGQRSAIRAANGHRRLDEGDDDGPIHVVVPRGRDRRAPAGVVLHWLSDFETKVHLNTSPPRQRFEEAVIDVAAAAHDELAAIAVLSDAVGSRRTTAQRLRVVLDGRTRVARRRFLADVLDDVAAGSCSVLEHGYLDRVERRHGLPSGVRQVRASARGRIYRDVEYVSMALVVELDGRVHHGSVADRDLDMDRDLDAHVTGRDTVRLGWGQVFRRPCATAARVSLLLVQRGWGGTLTQCPDCPG